MSKSAARVESLLKATPQLSSKDTNHIWVLADIQQGTPAAAKALLTAAVEDITALDQPLDCIWCLGDALHGANAEPLEEIADIFISTLAVTGLPVCYILGNHDMDLKRATDADRYPLFSRAQVEPNWHTSERLDDFFFAQRFGNSLVVFMGDHADPAGRWFTSHGGVTGTAPESYPHTASDYFRLTQGMATHDGPVILCSHYALPGGQKPSRLMQQLLPLPANVRLCLHGHAHIGDLVWNKDNPWQRNNPVTDHTLRQINISALESIRSPGSHSALLDLGPVGPASVRIRCHQKREWVETFTPADF